MHKCSTIMSLLPQELFSSWEQSAWRRLAGSSTAEACRWAAPQKTQSRCCHKSCSVVECGQHGDSSLGPVLLRLVTGQLHRKHKVGGVSGSRQSTCNKEDGHSCHARNLMSKGHFSNKESNNQQREKILPILATRHSSVSFSPVAKRQKAPPTRWHAFNRSINRCTRIAVWSNKSEAVPVCVKNAGWHTGVVFDLPAITLAKTAVFSVG